MKHSLVACNKLLERLVAARLPYMRPNVMGPRKIKSAARAITVPDWIVTTVFPIP